MDIPKHAGKSKSYVKTNTSSDIKLTRSEAKQTAVKKKHTLKKFSVI